MHKTSKIFTLLIVLFSLLAAGTTLQAASIKDRMAARIPEINDLKDRGLIGENNAGLLEYVTNQKPSQALIQEENNDRQTVYAAIAKKEGATPLLVGQRRAKMIAENGKNGQWFQSADGTWYQK